MEEKESKKWDRQWKSESSRTTLIRYDRNGERMVYEIQKSYYDESQRKKPAIDWAAEWTEEEEKPKGYNGEYDLL